MDDGYSVISTVCCGCTCVQLRPARYLGGYVTDKVEREMEALQVVFDTLDTRSRVRVAVGVGARGLVQMDVGRMVMKLLLSWPHAWRPIIAGTFRSPSHYLPQCILTIAG